MTSRRKFAVALSVPVLAAVGLVGITAQPALAAPGCGSNLICLHDQATLPPFATTVGNAPRNTCIEDVPPSASFITNNTSYQWFMFRTHNCAAGSHLTAYPNIGTDLTLISGWDNAIQSYYRTSST